MDGVAVAEEKAGERRKGARGERQVFLRKVGGVGEEERDLRAVDQRERSNNGPAIL